MKITNSDQQIIRNPDLSRADKADNLAGKKKVDSKVAADKSAAIKTDTVQLIKKSIDLARAAKPDSESRADGKTQTRTAQNMDENVLSKLLKMADKRSGIFGSSGISLKPDEQEEAAKKSGKKINFFL